jgi:hypothetical protein
MIQDSDAVPQPIGEFFAVDHWQKRINNIFYGLRGGQIRRYFQTFASADYRLAHALAADYFSRVRARETGEKGVTGVKGETSEKGKADEKGESRVSRESRPSRVLVIHEWGPGNGNLAACFLTHLKTLDTAGAVYPRVRYVLVDNQAEIMAAALTHPDLAPHRDRIETLCADVQHLETVEDGSVDRIICAELWNELPAKLLLRKDGEIEEEYIRPNLSETKHEEIEDWSGFVRAFDTLDVDALKKYPPFLEDIIWEKEYRKAEWKGVPFRKTITDFLKQIEEHVLVPCNVGLFASLKEAKRILAPDAVGLSAFDAGTDRLRVLNDPEKPCYGLFGGQYSFMVNFPLAESIAAYLGFQPTVEVQKNFVGRSLGAKVMSLMDLLAAYPAPKVLAPWEQDRLVLKTIEVLNQSYVSPYRRKLEFSLRDDTPGSERPALEALLATLKDDGIPDTVALVTEEEVRGALADLERLGYDRDAIEAMLVAPTQPVDYFHLFCALKGAGAQSS